MQASEGYSLESQLNLLTTYCEQRNYQLIEVYSDEGISAKTTNRPDFLRLMSDAANKRFDTVLIWKVSRFARNMKDLLVVSDQLEKYDVNIISYSEHFDTTTPTGRLMRNIIGAVAEFDLDNISENIKVALHQKATEGKRTQAFCLGYDLNSQTKQFTINKQEAKIIRFIFKHYIETENFSNVARICKKKGFKGKRNKDFRASSILTIVTNPAYLGYSRLHGEILYKESIFPCIISPKTFDTAQNIIKMNKRKTKKAKIRTISEFLDENKK